MKKKTIALVLALVLIVGAAIGGTVAYLTDKTASVTNTFTIGNIDITLAETKSDFKMVPGVDIEKDPKVTVEGGSEACYVFVKVEKSSNLDSFISYAIASGWTQGDGAEGGIPTDVYYRAVAASADDQVFSVLANDKVTTKGTVTKSMMDGLNQPNATQPSLTFTAYAIQQATFTTAAAAWAEVSK